MNKNLSRLCGTILFLEALYIIVYYFPLIIKSIIPETMAFILAGSVVVSVLLLLISGISLLFLKKWSVIILWISLGLSFVVSVFVGHSYPSFIMGDFQIWVIDLVIAIFLSIESRKVKQVV